MQLSAELRAKLTELAAQQGRPAEELAAEVLSRYVEDEAAFFSAVDEGIAAADRGEFVEQEEMDARIEAMKS